MTDNAQIGFEQLGLGAVLKRYRLLVPPNQREYAWTEKEVKKLLQDLSLAIAEDEPQHFFGTIVTIPRGNGLLEVVDGQQRLATTAIVLAAMKHISEGGAGNLPRALENYIVDVDTDTLEVAPKMTLNTADTTVFHELLLDGQSPSALPARDSHQKLIATYKLARAHLLLTAKTVADAERTRVFQRWMNYVEHKARAILLVVPDTVNAFKMFETLNDRGLKVSQSDLVKNYIFGQAGARLPEAQQTWAYTKGALETLEEDDITMTFLRQSLIAMKGYLREAEVYEEVQKSAKGVQSSLSFLLELEALANDYVAIQSADSEKWNSYPAKTRALLRVLQLFDIKPFRPLLLAIAHRFEPKEATAACEHLVALGVRLIVAASTRSGSVEQPLAKAAKQVFDRDITTSVGLRTALGGITPSDEQFREAFEVATVSQAKFARYYLRSIELKAKGEPDPYLIPNDDPDAINLEHILPLKPMGNWPHWSDEEVKVYSKRIGNLALLKAKPNSDLKSASFDEKRPILAQSPYATTSMAGAAEAWTPVEITSRQTKLAELAVETWPA